MSIKHKVKILFFCLYLGTLGRYFLNLVISSKIIDTLLTLIIDFLIISLTISLLKFGSRYLKYLIMFVIISTISYLLSNNTYILTHINGIRETFVFICYFYLMDTLSTSRERENMIKEFSTFAFIFLIIQLPVSIIQYLQFGPGDSVGGTYGDGGSGLLTFSIFLLIYFLIEYNIKSPSERLKTAFPFLVFLLPIALNETKISFVLLLLFFTSFANFQKMTSLIVFISIGILAVVSFSFFYSTQENVSYKNPIEGIYSNDFLENYLNGEIDDGFEDIPRFTKLTAGVEVLVKDDVLFLGKDYGAFMFNQTKSRTEFSKKYKWLLIGTIPYSFYLLMSGGVLLFLLINWMIFFENFSRYDNKFYNFYPPLFKFSIALYIITLFYNDSFRSVSYGFIFVFVLVFSKLIQDFRYSRKKLIIKTDS